MLYTHLVSILLVSSPEGFISAERCATEWLKTSVYESDMLRNELWRKNMILSTGASHFFKF